MNPVLTFDTREFTRALGLYAEATQKDEAEILNRAARNLAYRAAQNTPVAQAAEIKSGLFRDEHLRFALTSIALKKRGIGALKSPEFQKEVDRFVARRIASRRYLRAAWAPAIIALGGSFRGTKFKGIVGEAKKATARKLVAEILTLINQPDQSHAKGAEEIVAKALQKALDFVAQDMIQYADRKLSQTARKYSHA